MEVILLLVLFFLVLYPILYSYGRFSKVQKQMNRTWYPLNRCLNEKFRVILKILDTVKNNFPNGLSAADRIDGMIRQAVSAPMIEENLQLEKEIDEQFKKLLSRYKSESVHKLPAEIIHQYSEYLEIEARIKSIATSYNKMAELYNREMGTFTKLVLLFAKEKKYPLRQK